jgi:hypothetical protein
VEVARLEDVAAREILLLGCETEACLRANGEVAALVFVEEAAENGWRVEFRPGSGQRE